MVLHPFREVRDDASGLEMLFLSRKHTLNFTFQHCRLPHADCTGRSAAYESSKGALSKRSCPVKVAPNTGAVSPKERVGPWVPHKSYGMPLKCLVATLIVVGESQA